jgi:hypothetical protein
MSVLVLVVMSLAAAEPAADPPLPIPAQTQTGQGPGQAGQAKESSPLEARSSGEWRKFLVQWRQHAVAAVPARYPLAAEHRASIARVRDGQAVPALVALLKQERDLRIRAAYFEILGRIDTAPAVQALVTASLGDETGWLRQLAAEQMEKMSNRDAATEPYARAVRNGRFRERALEALNRSGLTSPRSSSELPNPTLIAALIDAIWVPQIEWVQGEFYFEGAQRNPSIEPPNDHFWAYRRGMVPVEKLVKNPVAHETLRRYSGEDYEYDQVTWRAWYGTRRRATGQGNR